MSAVLDKIQRLVENGEIRISEHGYDELAADGLYVRDVCAGLADAALIEEYPDFHKGECVLVLEEGRDEMPVHVVWGIPKGEDGPAVLVTAYRPDPDRWKPDFRSRKK